MDGSKAAQFQGILNVLWQFVVFMTHLLFGESEASLVHEDRFSRLLAEISRLFQVKLVSTTKGHH